MKYCVIKMKFNGKATNLQLVKIQLNDPYCSINGQGRTEIFRRVSRASRQSFRVPGMLH
jgi:hypothetical protein